MNYFSIQFRFLLPWLILGVLVSLFFAEPCNGKDLFLPAMLTCVTKDFLENALQKDVSVTESYFDNFEATYNSTSSCVIPEAMIYQDLGMIPHNNTIASNNFSYTLTIGKLAASFQVANSIGNNYSECLNNSTADDWEILAMEATNAQFNITINGFTNVTLDSSDVYLNVTTSTCRELDWKHTDIDSNDEDIPADLIERHCTALDATLQDRYEVISRIYPINYMDSNTNGNPYGFMAWVESTSIASGLFFRDFDTDGVMTNVKLVDVRHFMKEEEEDIKIRVNNSTKLSGFIGHENCTSGYVRFTGPNQYFCEGEYSYMKKISDNVTEYTWNSNDTNSPYYAPHVNLCFNNTNANTIADNNDNEKDNDILRIEYNCTDNENTGNWNGLTFTPINPYYLNNILRYPLITYGENASNTDICVFSSIYAYYNKETLIQHTINTPENWDDVERSALQYYTILDDSGLIQILRAYFNTAPFSTLKVVPTAETFDSFILNPEFWAMYNISIPFRNNKIGADFSPDPSTMEFVDFSKNNCFMSGSKEPENGSTYPEGHIGARMNIDITFYTADHDNTRLLYNLMYFQVDVYFTVSFELIDSDVYLKFGSIVELCPRDFEIIYPFVGVDEDVYNKLNHFTACSCIHSLATESNEESSGKHQNKKGKSSSNSSMTHGVLARAIDSNTNESIALPIEQFAKIHKLPNTKWTKIYEESREKGTHTSESSTNKYSVGDQDDSQDGYEQDLLKNLELLYKLLESSIANTMKIKFVESPIKNITKLIVTYQEYLTIYAYRDGREEEEVKEEEEEEIIIVYNY